jgi:glycosyltransferase involved in cell wall biosynthesis
MMVAASEHGAARTPDESTQPRIALVASSAYPNLGGVEQHVRSVARELRDRGYAVEVWTVARDGVERHDAVDGIPVLHLPAPLPAKAARSLAHFAVAAPTAWRAWTTAHRRFRPHLLQVQCFGPNGLYALALSRRFGTALAVSSHGETFMDEDAVFDTSIALRTGLRQAIRRAAFVTGCSAYTLRDLRARFGLVGGAVVFNGVDLDGREARHPAAEGAPTIFAVGRLVHVKGMDLLLRAFAAATLPHGTRLMIGGDGSERSELDRLAGELGINDRVDLVGRLEPETVERAMRSASVLAVPSRVEAFGIVVLEGWRAGAPVIVTDRGGPPEFVTHLQDGYLVAADQVDELRAALEFVLGDPVAAAGMARAGGFRVHDFTWATAVDAYEEQYRAHTSLPAAAGRG